MESVALTDEENFVEEVWVGEAVGTADDVGAIRVNDGGAWVTDRDDGPVDRVGVQGVVEGL